MRNKSKLAKIKKQKTPQYPKDWLYMSVKTTKLQQLKSVLESKYSIEYWEEAGVLEVALEEDGTAVMDFETVDMQRADEVTIAYIKEQGVEQVFLVSIQPEVYMLARKVMEQIIAAEGGFFCGDTEDFMPRIDN